MCERLHEVVTGTLRAWQLVAITLYADDATIEAMRVLCVAHGWKERTRESERVRE